MTLNYLAIILGAVGGMVVGAIWFARPAFGPAWAGLTGVDTSAKTPPSVYLLSTLATLVTSAVIAGGATIAHEVFGGSYLVVALTVSAILWLGFTASRNAVEYLFESRPARLFAIDMGHQLAVVLVMGLVIGLLGR